MSTTDHLLLLLLRNNIKSLSYQYHHSLAIIISLNWFGNYYYYYYYFPSIQRIQEYILCMHDHKNLIVKHHKMWNIFTYSFTILIRISDLYTKSVYVIFCEYVCMERKNTPTISSQILAQNFPGPISFTPNLLLQ